MRVSERQRYMITAGRVEQAKSDNTKMLEKLSSQKEINRLSDGPVEAIRAIKMRDRLSGIDQFKKNVDFAKGYLERTESAISGITDKIIRAKELAIGMANDTYDANSRAATAREIKEVMNEVVQLANTTYNGRFILSGFRNQTPALSPDGNYLGDDGAIYLQMDQGNFKQLNIPARNLFETTPDEAKAGHFNLVASLEILYEGLVNNDKHAINLASAELEFQQDKVTSYQATIGGMWNALDQTGSRLGLDSDHVKETLSKVEDVDFYKTTQDFKQTETVLQSTLMASNKLLQPSLMNFMQ